MRQTILTLLSFLISYTLFSQVTTSDNFEIKLQKVRQVYNESLFQSSELQIKSNELVKIMVKVKIKSKGQEKLNLSAFSLLDIDNKIRYRLADYKGYTGIIGFPEYIPYLKTQVSIKKNIGQINVPKYDPNQKDFFNDFDKTDYQNFEVPVNFGSKENPNLSIMYFGNTAYTNFTAELFFGILIKNKESNYELYYKDEKVSKINMK